MSDVGDFVGEQRISEECSTHKFLRKHIYVRDVALVCDEVLYDDDEKEEDSLYTNSLTCRTGDRAKVAVVFDIVRYSGNYDVTLTMYTSLFGKLQLVRNETNLCDFNNLNYWGGDIRSDDLYQNALTTPCPLRNGPYALFASFIVPAYTKDDYFDITPDLHLEFHRNDKRGSRSLVGCVETGTLAEVGFSKSMERRGERFFVSCTLVGCLIFAFVVTGYRQKKERLERARRKQKASMMRRFHYIRTTRSGEAGMALSTEMVHPNMPLGDPRSHQPPTAYRELS